MDEHNHDSACAICLDPLCTEHSHSQDPSSAYVAKLSGCSHIYHHVCIESWSERSNVCPSCRTKFNHLTIYEYVGGPQVNRIAVTDKVPVFDSFADDTPDVVDLDDPVPSTSMAVCSICDGIDDVSWMMVCYTCRAAFHITCIDIDEVISTGWCCPVCEAPDLHGDRTLARAQAGPYFFRRINAARRARANRNTTRTRAAYRLGTVLAVSSGSRATTRRNRATWPGNSPLSPSASSPIMISMSLLDNETEIREPAISAEETEAWNMFDIARGIEKEEAGDEREDTSSGTVSTSIPTVSISPPSALSTSIHISSASACASSASVSSSSASSERKLKRPSRSKTRTSSSTSQTPNKPVSDSIVPACSPIQKLLGDIRSSPQGKRRTGSPMREIEGSSTCDEDSSIYSENDTSIVSFESFNEKKLERKENFPAFTSTAS